MICQLAEGKREVRLLVDAKMHLLRQYVLTVSNQVPPMAEENAPFNLCFISGNIAKCAGCGNRYVKPPTHPYDMCIQHREWRSFVPQGSTSQRKFSPAYYHVNLLCIRANWPLFKPEHLVVSEEVNTRLRQGQRDLLQSFNSIC